MPYAKRKVSDGKWEVVNKDTGKVEGHTTSEAEAQKMIEAIYANTHGEGEKALRSPDALDTLVALGGEVKALRETDEELEFGGLLVPYGSADEPDTQGDYFTPNTDYGLDTATKARCIFHHGFDTDLGLRKLTNVAYKATDAGIWAEGIIRKADAYATKICEMVKAGKLRFSSGSAPHLIQKRPVKGACEILSWPIVEASLTPTPVDPRAVVMPLKALLGVEDPAVKSATEDGAALVRAQYEHKPEPPMPAHHRALHSALDSLHGMHAMAVKGYIADTGKTPAVKAKMIGQCHDEYKAMSLKACKAMLADDGAMSDADADDEAPAVKSLSDEFARRLAAGPSLASDLQRLATEAEELGSAFKAHAGHRAAEGRHVSPVKREELGRLIDAIKATLGALTGHFDATAPRPDPARLRAIRLAALRQQHELDALLLG